MWTGRKSKKVQPPWEWTELQLCREVYHCSRTELYAMDWAEVAFDLEMLAAENEIDEAEKAAKKGSGYR